MHNDTPPYNKELQDTRTGLVSVIIPNYNHSAFLERRIRSVFEQSYKHIEVIVLDDCSTDNSLEVIGKLNKQFPFALILNESNSGNTFRQWQKGLSFCHGEFVWIAESDDDAAPTFLETLVSKLSQNKSAALGFAQSEIIDDKGGSKGVYKNGKKEIDKFYHLDQSLDGLKCIEYYLGSTNLIPNVSAILFRRDLMPENLEELFLYRLSGDWLYYIRCMMNGGLEYCASPLNKFRIHSSTVRNATQRTALSLQEHLHILREVLKVRKWSYSQTSRFFKSFYTRLGFQMGQGRLLFTEWLLFYLKAFALNGPAAFSTSFFFLKGFLISKK